MTAAAVDADRHRAEVEAWRQQRHDRLRQPMSWLSLVALEWLREGVNRLGNAPNAELRLPSGPAIAGRLVRSGRAVTAHGEPGGELTHEGRPVEGLALVSDADAPPGSGPTLLDLGSLRMCVIRRGDRIGLRAWDTAAPALRRFDGIAHYPVDAAWRFVARFEPAPPCVFTPYATCPLPPPVNRLPLRVEAGEKAWSGRGHPTGP